MDNCANTVVMLKMATLSIDATNRSRQCARGTYSDTPRSRVALMRNSAPPPRPAARSDHGGLLSSMILTIGQLKPQNIAVPTSASRLVSRGEVDAGAAALTRAHRESRWPRTYNSALSARLDGGLMWRTTAKCCLSVAQQFVLGAALEHFAEKRAAGFQHFAGKSDGRLRQPHDPQMIGAGMARCRRGHVGEHHIGERLAQQSFEFAGERCCP